MSIGAVRCKTHHRKMGLPFQVQQIAFAADGRRAMRLLTAEDGEIVKGAWQQIARPFKPGLYCQQCLNDGIRAPLPIDEEDLPDLELADRPVLFIQPESFEVDALLTALDAAYPGNGRYVHELPASKPEFADDQVLERLMPGLRNSLRQRVLGKEGRLYRFQAEALNAALDGRDVIVTTPTASGKTLTYLLPILDRLLRDPQATALYLSPLVALTEDQMAAVTAFDGSGTDWEKKGGKYTQHLVCRELKIGSQSLTVARYDGSVLDGDRKHIRTVQPQYVLTTPDMLHMGLLTGAFDEPRWAYFFKNLRYVVVDEMHTYKGTFGASFANLMRRLRRVCRAYGVSPQILSASATISDPARTAERLTGRRPVVVDGGLSGGPQHRRKFVLSYDRIDDDRRKLSTQAKNMLLFCLRNHVYTIAFARSISEINDILRFATAELRESEQQELMLSPFMRELKTSEKRRIIRELKDGKMHAVVSTTALSMGIDIGSLSAAIIIGFPGSIAQLWQQAGRAGRAGEGLIVLIADENPLDQFFVNHPEVLFDISAEPVYLNPDNPYIVKGHLLSAARELALSDDEISSFGATAAAVAQELEQTGTLVRDPDTGKLVLSSDAMTKFGVVPLRNLNFSVDVMTEDRTETIVQVDAARAQRALHKYAHYQYLDRYFEVVRFDVDFENQQGQILVRKLEKPEYTTTAKVAREVAILNEVDSVTNERFSACFGQVESRAEVVGYYKVPLFSRMGGFPYQPLGVAAPPPLEYQTHGLWLTFDEVFFGMHPAAECDAGLYSLAEAMRLAIAVEELTDPSDLVATSSVADPATGKPMIIIHDATPGGVGIVEAAFQKLDRVLARAHMILADCPYCAQHPASRGCPRCVTARYGDAESINRNVALDLLRQLAAPTLKTVTASDPSYRDVT